jgi:hypothetical protein
MLRKLISIAWKDKSFNSVCRLRKCAAWRHGWGCGSGRTPTETRRYSELAHKSRPNITKGRAEKACTENRQSSSLDKEIFVTWQPIGL